MGKNNVMVNIFSKLRYWQQQTELKGDDIHILPYRGYGTFDRVQVSARVLEYHDMRPNITDGAFRNAVNMYRRFESDELPNCALELQIADHIYPLNTDKEGYINQNILLRNPIVPIAKRQWYRSDWRLTDAAFNDQNIAAAGEIFIPNGNMQYGIITDIDDTVLKTHVVSKSKMLYYTFFKNAYSRLAFAGVTPLYWAWQKGDNGKCINPIFYVSNSPHNLYDLLCDFMRHNDLPKGPILLRDIVLPNSAQILAYKTHKYDTIVRLLNTYPNLPFLLVGDSGERDADIYTEIAGIFPNRIKAIYIRSVDDPQRNKRVQSLLERCETTETLLFDNSLAVMQHSANKKWVQTRWLQAVNDALLRPKHNQIWEDWIDEDEN
jgi:phosphatidate phosphatase APP1